MNINKTKMIASMVFGLVLSVGAAQAAQSVAHLHMGHVIDAWSDAPEGKGLLPTAIAEAEIARTHATAASKKKDDLAWMQMHAHHVLHTLDPSLEAQGPGLGFGVGRAAAGTAKHIKAAASSADASDNVTTHAVHVATSARNTLARVDRMKTLIQQILDAKNAADAREATMELQALSVALLEGEDANGDGTVTWQEGEGGLLKARKHMQIMSKGEGL